MINEFFYFLSRLLYFHKITRRFVTLWAGDEKNWYCSKCGYICKINEWSYVCPKCHRIVIFPGWTDEDD